MEVGPVLMANALGRAVSAAILSATPGARVVDQGSYLRVSGPGRCVLERLKVEELTRQPFTLPADLETVMVSFKGRLKLAEEKAEWWAP
jgi:hypothetical protein